MISVTRLCYTSFYGLQHSFLSFFFNDTSTTKIYTLSLHDALPICDSGSDHAALAEWKTRVYRFRLRLLHDLAFVLAAFDRSEEHTSELQSQSNLVCRLLLEKKKK